MVETLKKKKLFTKVNWGQFLDKGTIVRQIGKKNDHQGSFDHYDDNGSMILLNVLDMKTASYAVDAGILKEKKNEDVFKYKGKFDSSPAAFYAIELVKNWTLYQKHPELQNNILNFVKSSFVPELIKYWRQTDQLYRLFVPIQQKFEIGRFKKTKNWDDFLKDIFKSRLDLLTTGEHITYLANIPNLKIFKNQFYSIGKESHVDTDKQLQKEPFIFCATHAGHIKVIDNNSDKKHFIVDVGSSYKGQSINAPISFVKPVASALQKEFPNFKFTAVPGREAYGYVSNF